MCERLRYFVNSWTRRAFGSSARAKKAYPELYQISMATWGSRWYMAAVAGEPAGADDERADSHDLLVGAGRPACGSRVQPPLLVQLITGDLTESELSYFASSSLLQTGEPECVDVGAHPPSGLH